MKIKKLLKISLVTLPLSIIIFLVLNYLMSFIAGGLATSSGFPIPYYRDVYETPEVDFYQPWIIILDVIIIFIPVTLAAIGYTIANQKINNHQNEID
ncbi:MAG TPA: hypothetical protein VK255_00970 [Patescibacteria group bacterium]|nr:hypothetical protein [Patescibacteria group bacterium]